MIETETAIICRFDPTFYISDRRACLFDVIEKYRDKIPDEFIDWLYSGEVNLWEVDNIETALLKLEQYVGKTIITRPTTDESFDP
jgi:hypothetical protein